MYLRRAILVLVAVAGSLGLAHAHGRSQATDNEQSGAACTLPESDAVALAILNYYYPNKYVWDDTPPGREGASGAQRLRRPRGSRAGCHRGLGRRFFVSASLDRSH